MKVSPLLAGVAGLTLIALTATTLYAQTTTGTSLVDKMKATVHTFTLAADLNAGQTGYESAPIAGKKTGNILTAGEWNRVLELLGQGGSSGWVNVPLDTAEFDKSCEYRFQTITPTNTVDDPYMGNDPYHYVNAVDNDRLTWFILPGSYHHINFDSKTIYRINGVPNTDATISKIEKLCGGSGASDSCTPSASDIYDSGWVGLSDSGEETRTFNHNLGTTDTIVYIEGKGDNSDSGYVTANSINYLDVGTPVFYWKDKTQNDIKIYRSSGAVDFAKYVKVIMWKKSALGGGCGGSGGSSGAFGTAWVNFDGTESTITMKGASGIASVTKVSAGNYQINFSTPKANTDYGVICTSGPSPAYLCFPHSKTTTGVLIKTSNPTSNVDAAYVSVVIN